MNLVTLLYRSAIYLFIRKHAHTLEYTHELFLKIFFLNMIWLFYRKNGHWDGMRTKQKKRP